MAIFLGRMTLSGVRSPLGHQLPRTLVPRKDIVSQLMKMSSTTLVTYKNKNESTKLVPKDMMKMQVRNSSSGDHVTLWTMEKALSAAMLPIVPMALLYPSAPLDYLLAFTITLHGHWGIEAIVVDYVRPAVFGETIPKLALALLYGLSTLTLGGLFYFVYADVGIANAIRLLWKL